VNEESTGTPSLSAFTKVVVKNKFRRRKHLEDREHM
jgi:hypothetical protein